MYSGNPGNSPAYTAGKLLLLFIILAPGNFLMAQVSRDQPEEKLESIRTRIKDVETNIQTARQESDQLYLELQRNEAAAAAVSLKLNAIEDDINQGLKSLAELNVRKNAAQASLAEEREFLRQQIRAAHKIGKNDYIKLLLNQEEPALVGRMLAYYDYFNRARTTRIEKVMANLDEIDQIEKQILSEKQQLDLLQASQLSRLEEYTEHRNSRNEIIARLEIYIDEQDRQLQLLQQNEQEIVGLINRLQEDKSVVQTFEDITPFNELRGKLNWPVNGKLTGRFGAARKGGKIKSRGVTISSDPGSDVAAISPGKIIFADWFRNMGLMIIIDHGNGFMSLYGHNQRLVKKVGDWVTARETIAKVGDTGGQQQANLYFEIRKGGDPMDPSLWCSAD